MKTLEKIQNRLEDLNNFANILADKAGVENYYTQAYNDVIEGGGFDFDLMYDCDGDTFIAVDSGWGRTYAQQNNMIFISMCTNIECEEDLENVVNCFIEQETN